VTAASTACDIMISLQSIVYLLTGSPGPAGQPGIDGWTGPRGSPGSAGQRGSPGQPGLVGRVGAPGATGQTGPVGSPGVRGLRGEFLSSSEQSFIDVLVSSQNANCQQ